jgi:hypothetical protein
LDHVKGLWYEIKAETVRLQKESDKILGCRFLYSSHRTFQRNTGLLIAGINPGKEKDMRDRAYPEGNINAYLSDDEWSGSPFRSRMVDLMRGIYAHYGILDTDGAINATLTSNLVPFRTHRFNLRGATREQALGFSKDLWARALPLCGIRAVLCTGEVSYRGFLQVAKRPGIALLVSGVPHASHSSWRDSYLNDVIARFDENGFVPNRICG